MERELDNIRAALSYFLERGEDRERIEMALRLGASLREFWVVRSHEHEGWTELSRALERSEGVAIPVRAKALMAAGNLVGDLGNADRGAELCQQSLVLYRESGDLAGVGEALLYLGLMSWQKGDLATARNLYEQSLEVCKEMGDQNRMGWSLFGLSTVDMFQGDYTQGYSHAEKSLLLFRETGNTFGIAFALQGIAQGYLYEGDAVKAHPLFEESYALFKEIGSKTYARLALCGLGWVAFQQGKIALARSLLEESANYQGEEEPADLDNKAWALAHLAWVMAFEGDYVKARALYEQCLAISKQVSNKFWTPFYLEGLAAVVAAQGEFSWAARLWGRAEALREGMGSPIPPAYRADYERSVAATRTQLGEQAFTAAWAEGRSMTLDQVLGEQGKAKVTTLAGTAQPARPMMKPSASYPDGLTAREVEVLRCVAKGLTDAQIAEQLTISPRTVNNHLTSIYNKIQVSSRAAATRYATLHQLV